MKLRLASLALLLCALSVTAAVRTTSVSLNTYVDFATNSGRYCTGTTNALLEYLRKRDGGVRIPYTNGNADYTLPHGMPCFDSVADMGNTTLVHPNYIATVAHNASRLYPTFSIREYGVGSKHAQRYITIEEYGANTACVNHIFHDADDFKLSRLCKISTDAVPARMTSGGDYKGKLVYRVGGGLQQLRDADGRNSDESIQDVYLVGGVAGIINWQKSTTDDRVHVGTVLGTATWGADAPGEGTPLPFGSTQGDSGSPYFVWGGSSEFLMAHRGSTAGNRQTIGCEARNWALGCIQADTANVCMGKVRGKLLISAPQKADDKGGVTDIFNGQQVTISPAVSYMRDEQGNLYNNKGEAVCFRGVEKGQHTWKSLTPLKDTDTWYTYGEEYLNATDSVIFKDKEATIAGGVTYAKLFHTQNLRLWPLKQNAVHAVEATETVDLGVGYLHFAADKCLGVTYQVSSPAGHLIDCAGYVVDNGVTVNMSLCNTDASYMREWRRVGDGTFCICGKGNNEIMLNIGGKGLTVLEQSAGYAAYNVLVNSGATLRIKNTEQIARDLTIGAGGGTLDLAGNSLEWFSHGGEKRPGFSLRALTEEAVITNSCGHAVLSLAEPAAPAFRGSFRDTAEGALTVVYDGGNLWELHGIRTALCNPQSGLVIKKGHVRLSGTPTIHGYGTKHTRETADFSTLADDWHYADATMNVRVAEGAQFSLGSHARLVGNVTLSGGATYTMHQGVNHDSERIEGGERPESTAAIADFYGHKGDVLLSEKAELLLAVDKDTDATTTYAGKIDGPGAIRVKNDSDKAAFVLSGKVKVKEIQVQSGKLNLQGDVSAAHTAICQGAALTLQQPDGELLSICANGKTATLQGVAFCVVAPKVRKLLGTAGSSAAMDHATLQVVPGTTLSLVDIQLKKDCYIAADGASLFLQNVELTPEVATEPTALKKSVKLKASKGSSALSLKAGERVAHLAVKNIGGKATIGEKSSVVLNCSNAAALPRVICLHFADGVRFESASSLQISLKSAGGTIKCKLYTHPTEPHVLYLIRS